MTFASLLVSTFLARFILQHGGRVLLADEMGLGKTLQAIAVTTCVQESWPVLIIAPSSLRLHWATVSLRYLNSTWTLFMTLEMIHNAAFLQMIHQWLHVPPSDIVVCSLVLVYYL
jgi:SWI/SNF-related matrix-associated actin-dependent regulator 1 of chromatin subfamily A